MNEGQYRLAYTSGGIAVVGPEFDSKPVTTHLELVEITAELNRLHARAAAAEKVVEAARRMKAASDAIQGEMSRRFHEARSGPGDGAFGNRPLPDGKVSDLTRMTRAHSEAVEAIIAALDEIEEGK